MLAGRYLSSSCTPIVSSVRRPRPSVLLLCVFLAKDTDPENGEIKFFLWQILRQREKSFLMRVKEIDIQSKCLNLLVFNSINSELA